MACVQGPAGINPRFKEQERNRYDTRNLEPTGQLPPRSTAHSPVPGSLQHDA
jgi:hypothetical protein